MQAPIAAVDIIMGNGSLTAERDLIGDISTALHAEGIRFMLYYHHGIQQEPPWTEKQDWPATFAPTGTGDRSVFFDNWVNVISDIGARYGKNLDGWFFDDGAVYYPAPFEKLGAAARTGNTNRLISFNPWCSARVTEFQDVYFGEGSHGELVYGSAPAGGDGIFTDGPHKGLLQHGMFVMEGGWGIHDPNCPITTAITGSQAIEWVRAAMPRKVPLSFDMNMWEDGTVGCTSLQIMTDLDVRFATPADGIYNNSHTQIIYSGSSWSNSDRRGGGDYLDDVQIAGDDGDFFEFTFIGTGIDVIMPLAVKQGNVEIYIDDELIEIIDTRGSSYQPLQVVYSNRDLSAGTHTLKVVKAGGDYMQLDAVRVYGASS